MFRASITEMTVEVENAFFCFRYTDIARNGTLPELEMLYKPIESVCVTDASDIRISIGTFDTMTKTLYATQLALCSGFTVQNYCGVDSFKYRTLPPTSLVISRWPCGLTYHAAMAENIPGEHLLLQ